MSQFSAAPQSAARRERRGDPVIYVPKTAGQTGETNVWTHGSSEPKLNLGVSGGPVVVGPHVRQPRRAASIAAMSILFICIIASNARLATARSGSVTALVRAIGVICQERPHLSLHQPHALS